jgi:serine/threonine protein kinase
MNIIHRYIKPENLVFDGSGYLHLTDFGISKKIKSGKPIINNSGTPGYFAPEVLMKKPQNFCSDFFSVGVICFELLYGKKPFKGNNRKEVSEKLLYKNIKLKSMDVPYGFSEYIADFINRLLKRNQKERLGYKGIDEIKNHRWLKDVNWELMENKNIESEKIPFSPFIGDNFDMDYVNKKDNIYSEHYDEYLKKINEAEILKDFYFNYHNNLLPNKKRNSISKEKQSNSNKKYTNTTSGNKTTRAMSDGLNASNDTCFENNENNNNGIEIMKNSNLNNDENINELNIKKSISC